jgi:2-hydroxy-3-keto-5-methylthiopentenyl-1-phosphate phosphatase
MEEFIRPVLEREGLGHLPLVSNTVDPDPAGWRVHFRDDDPCEVCGEPCKLATVRALADGAEVVYVGDGYSDRCAAQHADRVFARRGLARWLDERGIPYEPFEDFHTIARSLEAA